MGLADLAYGVEHVLLYWLAAVAVLVLYRCLTGDVNVSGMLSHDDDSAVAADRAQLLFVFLLTLGTYARSALATQGFDAPLPSKLPEAPTELVALFGASHTVYLSGKFGRFLTLFRGG